MRFKFNLKKLLPVLSVLLVVFFSLPSLAGGKEKLSLKTEGYLVKFVLLPNGNKKEELKPLPEKVYPGDVIEYRVIATNTSNGDLKDVVIRVRVPTGTSYVPGSASDSPEFSIDGGKSYSSEPVKYVVVENGKKVIKTATPDMYTNLRWKVEFLKPGEERVFKYRVQVKPLNE